MGQMIETYLTQRDTLKGVISLVDGRHEPTADDQQMYTWLSYYEIPVLVVATKMDKIARGKWNKQLSMVKKTLNILPRDTLVAFSAKQKRVRTRCGIG